MTLPVSIVIPALNEAENLKHLLPNMPDVNEIIIVGGGDDATAAVAQSVPNALVLAQQPSGKGAATMAGINMATSEFVVCMDADGSMDPADIDKFVRYLQYGAHVVKGSRTMPLGGSSDFTLIRRAGNYGLPQIYNLLTAQLMTDITYGYIGLRRDVVPDLNITATGFEIEVQMVAHAHRLGMMVREIPCFEHNRISGTSHLNVVRDGMRILSTISASKKLRSALDTAPVVC